MKNQAEFADTELYARTNHHVGLVLPHTPFPELRHPMKAVITTKYGPPEVMELRDVETPAPGDDELLVRVIAATVFTGDCEMRRFDFPLSFWLPLRLMFGLWKPRKRVRVPGQELAGVVEAAGKNHARFRKGDAVVAPLTSFGACAEFVVLKGNAAIGAKPENMSFDEAATVPVGGLNALCFLRAGEVGEGDEVLINGAGGSIGTWAVQIARAFGARVTAVDCASKLDMLHSIGAADVIDYAQQDFTKMGRNWDVIIDVVGKSSWPGSLRSLVTKGRYVHGNPRFFTFFRSLWATRTSNRTVKAALAAYRTEDLEFLRGLIEAGKIRSVIDRRYPLEQIVEAHRYVETGRKAGHVVISVQQEKVL